MYKNHYSYSTVLGMVTTLYQEQGPMHRARVKAVAWVLQGLLVLRQATLWGMGRGLVVAHQEMTFARCLFLLKKLSTNQDT